MTMTSEPATTPAASCDVPVLEVRDLTRHYQLRAEVPFGHKPVVRALDGVDLAIRRGESLGVVGESGCGKSTLARVIAGLDKPTSGQVLYRGQDVVGLTGEDWREMRRNIQLVFQDPYSSLDPRMTVERLIGEPFRIHPDVVPKDKRRARIAELVELVGLNPDHLDRYPHEFSGGQRQRIGIARGIALNPELLVCDEPVSALDVSVRAQVVNLLLDLQGELGLSYLFIAHDLQIVRHVSDRLLTMYLGRVVETGESDQVYDRPGHPYTTALLAAAPELRTEGEPREQILVQGDPPSPVDPPSGCRFRTRCWLAADICAHEEPPLLQVEQAESGHQTRCHFTENVYAAMSDQS